MKMVKYFEVPQGYMWRITRNYGARMKFVFAFMLSMTLSGCTASDWIDAAGGIMQAQDNHEKDSRNKRIKAANKAAGY